MSAMTKEEIARWKEMSEDERRDFYFERKRKNRIKVAIDKAIPALIIMLFVAIYVGFVYLLFTA